ncbi:unnamed protein product [Tetraodon nigroviridis]|nr:unnamed protein product [Tetraodon nigroviridis]
MIVVNIHLHTTSQVLVDVNNVVMSSGGSPAWQKVNSKSKLGSNQRDVLRLVAELHGCRF